MHVPKALLLLPPPPFLLKPKPPFSSSILPHLIKPLSTYPSLPDFDQTPSPAIAATPLSAAEANPLEKIHALIKDHHRANSTPDPTLAPPPKLTVPSLSSSFSLLSPSCPPSPALACSLLDRLSSLCHGILFPQALAFFNWWLSSIPPSPSLYPAFAELIDLAGKLHHFDIAWHLLDRMCTGTNIKGASDPLNLPQLARLLPHPTMLSPHHIQVATAKPAAMDLAPTMDGSLDGPISGNFELLLHHPTASIIGELRLPLMDLPWIGPP